ncbi:restriction endonuclease subunit S [Bifidobacterium adolescentis]|uniref:Restriction endonuclease S subunit n=1 Tax=Bifidobacterium adolescentis TaxID=1680 RepID=A0A173ZLW0_BIFAD|nr:restriction endonuclease subunit S [Bifidobacterium adolescentis]CUN76629.1 restriction endonuclease S subunit [Bifidobacterium adolescentis]
MAEQHEKALVPQIRFTGFTDPWEQRKLGELYQKNDERNTDGLGSERTLSVASMTFNSAGNGADDSSLPNYKRLRLGDIAFEGHTNKEFAYGRFVLNDAGNGIMSPRFTCLRPIVEQEYSFWKYFIHSEKVMRPILVNSTKSGTMMNELVVEDFLKQEILVPSLPEQRRIGAFFDRLDSLITLHQRKYDKLCVLKKSMLDKMFPKGGSLYPEIRFAGFTDPWEQRKLSSTCEQLSRTINPLETPNEEFTEYSMPAFDNNETAETVIGNSMNSLRKIVDRPCLLVNKLNVRKKRIWHVPRPEANAVCSSEFVPFSSHSSDLSFIKISLLSERITAYLESCSSGSSNSQKRVTPEIIMSSEIIAPSLAEQRRIGAFFDRLDSLITLHQRKLELLRNIKKSMLDKMFV